MSKTTLEVIKCDKCGRLQDASTAQYFEVHGAVEVVDKQATGYRDKNRTIVPLTAMPLVGAPNPKTSGTFTYCYSCLIVVLKIAADSD